MEDGHFTLHTQFTDMDKYSQSFTFVPFKEYPAINGLFGWFDPEVTEGKADSDIVKTFISTLPNDSREALEQGKQVLAKTPWPWQSISKCFNRHFPTEQETRQWFEGILKMIEEERKRQGLS